MSCAAHQGPRALRGKSVNPFARPLCHVLVPKGACRIWVTLGWAMVDAVNVPLKIRQGPRSAMIESQDSTSRTIFTGCCKFVTSILVPQAAESLTKVPSPQAFHSLASGHCLVASISWAGCHDSSLTRRGCYRYAPLSVQLFIDFQAHPTNAWKIQSNVCSLAKENFWQTS